jgi:hypothetical protein
MWTQPARLVRAYLAVVGSLLLASGVLGLLLHAGGVAVSTRPGGGFLTDPAHEWIHVVWGAALLLPLVSRQRGAGLAWLALIFGVFYTGFGLLGLLIYHPFGLQLGLDENGFHLLVGPLGVLLGGWALAARQPSAVAVPSAEARS